jgi:radical SAM protein with 4Fe4S-binding SPASM domain
MLPQTVLGQIGTDDLAAVWQKSSQLCDLRQRVNISLESFEQCRVCAWRESCTGNCPGTAATLTGQVNHPCPDTCLKRFQGDLTALGESLWM